LIGGSCAKDAFHIALLVWRSSAQVVTVQLYNDEEEEAVQKQSTEKIRTVLILAIRETERLK